ncbi:hypothetical protein U9F62_005663 [Pseudomonas aeruginosa]|uniref:hypothetical protein n=1 Tax=Pseudomonas aeruginosa TaxID=287 RepID=UPI002AD6ABBE|nr:hypothetical protein [Pseudomonas aeruginosa]
MIELPENGISPSVKKHNCNILAVADWIVSSALFGEEDVSRSDVVDILLENQAYREQDFCNEFVEQVWIYLNDFSSHVRINSLSFEAKKIISNGSWEEDLALSYCLTASLRAHYKKWSNVHCGDYLTQGSILEELTLISLANLHPQLSFKTTGWSGIKENENFESLVRRMCRETQFSEKDLSLWDNGRIKDLGLDVYGYLPGQGRRPSTHFMMYQCASGENWTEKRQTPNLDIWGDILKSYTSPIRGMSIPFFVEEKDFQQSLIIIKGPLLDRTLLLSRIPPEKISPELQGQIKEWVSERIKKLPYYD